MFTIKRVCLRAKRLCVIYLALSLLVLCEDHRFGHPSLILHRFQHSAVPFSFQLPPTSKSSKTTLTCKLLETFTMAPTPKPTVAPPRVPLTVAPIPQAPQGSTSKDTAAWRRLHHCKFLAIPPFRQEISFIADSAQVTSTNVTPFLQSATK